MIVDTIWMTTDRLNCRTAELLHSSIVSSGQPGRLNVDTEFHPLNQHRSGEFKLNLAIFEKTSDPFHGPMFDGYIHDGGEHRPPKTNSFSSVAARGRAA